MTFIMTKNQNSKIILNNSKLRLPLIIYQINQNYFAFGGICFTSGNNFVFGLLKYGESIEKSLAFGIL